MCTFCIDNTDNGFNISKFHNVSNHDIRFMYHFLCLLQSSNLQSCFYKLQFNTFSTQHTLELEDIFQRKVP